jgi:hypothetical protein
MKPTALRSYHVRTNIASSMKLGIWETSRVHVMMMIQGAETRLALAVESFQGPHGLSL